MDGFGAKAVGGVRREAGPSAVPPVAKLVEAPPRPRKKKRSFRRQLGIWAIEGVLVLILLYVLVNLFSGEAPQKTRLEEEAERLEEYREISDRLRKR